jgi:hypothetical protein
VSCGISAFIFDSLAVLSHLERPHEMEIYMKQKLAIVALILNFSILAGACGKSNDKKDATTPDVTAPSS